MRLQVIPLFITFLVIGYPKNIVAQNCGCAEDGNCPFEIVANGTSQVCYEITDALNNNLANATQGVCGLSITFTHGSVGYLDMTLTSPNGTSVNLTGANVNPPCIVFTPLSTWDILFVPSSVTAEPDTIGSCEYPATWNNCPIDCPWGNAIYNGSYYPYNGNLEDFNSGSVNGMWCLDINNTSLFNGGDILNFELILCDESGILCCDADAGNLAFVPDVEACEGDSSLIIDATPIYGPIEPDPIEHGYIYIISENDNILEYQTSVDLTAYSPGTYKVCGLSYLLADAANIPAPGLWTVSTLRNNLLSAAPLFCGDISNNCIFAFIDAPPPPVNLAETICEGTAFMLGDSSFVETGNYTVILNSFADCDSTINLDLTVLNVDTTFLIEMVCNGGSFSVGDSTYNQTGTFETLLSSTNGCDSVVMLDLTVLAPIEVIFADTICIGDSIQIGSIIYYETGTFSDTLQSFLNCDSIITFDLTVLDLNAIISPPAEINCNNPSIEINGNASSSGTGISYCWNTNDGNFISNPDSIIVAIDMPGTYIFTVKEQNCFDSDTVIVTADLLNPTADAGNPATLNCQITSIQLDGSTSCCGNLSFDWQSQNGSLISDSTTATPIISSPDIYTLTVTNINNGCTDSDSLVIGQDTIAPIAVAGADTTLNCINNCIGLNGSVSSGQGQIAFLWETITGNIKTGGNTPIPQVDAQGMYILSILDIQNFCVATDTVSVGMDVDMPVAILEINEPNDTLDCVTPIVVLDGGNSSTGPDLEYEWHGNIASFSGQFIAFVEEPGFDTLIVRNTVNGCVDSAFVEVVIDTIPPIADAGTTWELNCGFQTFSFNGNSSIGSEFIYEWVTDTGHFVSNSLIANPTIDSAGMYFLTVTDTLNGCTAMDSILIFADYNTPFADAGADGVLDCDNPSYLLDGSGSDNQIFVSLEWTTLGGDFVSDEITTTVNAPDFYVLTATNGITFCQATDTVTVAQDVFPPIAEAGPNQLLDCLTGQATLDGIGSEIGTNITYNWTSSDGIIFSDTTTLMPVVDAVGTYILTVTDTLNNCTRIDSTIVTIDSIACTPNVDAGADGLVSCHNLGFLDTLNSVGSQGYPFCYLWENLDGTPLNPADSIAPVVSTGTYILTITNKELNLFAADTVFVGIDTIAPIADAGVNILSLNCNELESCYALDASNSSQGLNFCYEWNSLDGDFCTPQNILNPEILGAGLYTLQVTNKTNGCTAGDAVLINIDGTIPFAEAGPTLQIECSETTTNLDCSASSQGANFCYQWETLDGNILGADTICNPTVSLNGSIDTFNLIVINKDNLCRDTDYVFVLEPTNCQPECDAGLSDTLTCVNDTLFLDGSASTMGTDICYQWIALSGNICGGDTTITPCIDAPGIYELTVTSKVGGANFSESCQVEIFEDVVFPNADAGAMQFLTCADTCITLDGSLSSQDVIYEWTTIGGNIKSGEDSPTPIIDQEGTYSILVTDPINGCTANDDVVVGINITVPTVNAGMDANLTCDDNSVVICGTGTPSNVIYQWSTDDGVICAGADAACAILCATGTYVLMGTDPVNGCTAIDSVEVTQDNDIPICDAGPDVFITCSTSEITLSASADGLNQLIYNWTAPDLACISNETTLSPTVSCPGTYQLEVTDMTNGCTCISEMQVIEDTNAPQADAGATMEITCTNLTPQLDGTGSTAFDPTHGLTFSWTTSDGNILLDANTASPTVDSAGLYELIIINDFNECQDTATVLITLDDNIPVANAGLDTTLTCARLSLDLNGNSSTTGVNVIYEWNTLDNNCITSGANSLAPTIECPGAYYLTVMDTSNNCSIMDTILVSLDTITPNANIENSIIPTITCLNQQVILNGSASTPIDSIAFEWTSATGCLASDPFNANLNVGCSATYTLTVTHDQTGCTSSEDIFVEENLNAPAVNFADPSELTCISNTETLQVFPPTNDPIYFYEWMGPGIFSGGGSSMPIVNQPGTYTVTISDSINGCDSTASILVIENVVPPNVETAALGELDCIQTSVVLSGAGSETNNVTYNWTTTSGGNISTPDNINTDADMAGWYFLNVTDLGNGCLGVDSVLLIANAIPIFDAFLDIDHPDCLDNEGYIAIDSVFGGSGNFVYALNDDIFTTFPQFSFLDPGSYNLMIEDASGCNWETTILLNPPNDINVDLGVDLTLDLGDSTTLIAQLNLPLDEIETIIWEPFGNLNCPHCLTLDIRPTETMTYAITVIDSTGCRGSDKINITVNEENPAYIPNAFSPDGDGTNDIFYVYAGQEIQLVKQLKIFDRWGNMVFAVNDALPNDPASGWDGTFQGKLMNAQVLVWMVELEFIEGGSEVLYGELLLMR